MVATEAPLSVPQKAPPSGGSKRDAISVPGPSRAHWTTKATNNRTKALIVSDFTGTFRSSGILDHVKTNGLTSALVRGARTIQEDSRSEA